MCDYVPLTLILAWKNLAVIIEFEFLGINISLALVKKLRQSNTWKVLPERKTYSQ